MEYDETRKTQLVKIVTEFQQLFDLSLDIMTIVDFDGQLKSINNAVERILGFTIDEIQTISYFKLIHPEDFKKVVNELKNLRRAKETLYLEFRALCKGGSYKWLAWTATASIEDDLIFAVGRDISHQKQIFEELCISEEKYKDIVEKASIAICTDNIYGELTYFNNKFTEIFGYSYEDMKNQTFRTLIHLDDFERILKYHTNRVNGKESPERYEFKGFRKCGSVIYIDVTVTIIRDKNSKIIGTRNFFRDITSRKEQENAIRKSLSEKEVLLKEIHHRVKNNLQIVCSLLYLQSRRSTDPEIIEALSVSTDRIKSMALIHEKLYNASDFTNIDFKSYIESLTRSLVINYKIGSTHINLVTDIQASKLELTKAIPCGLIVNELVTNSLKHAFANTAQGEIFIGFYSDDRDVFTLCVKDNGKGFSNEELTSDKNSLGMTIVETLTKQLSGKLDIESNNGATITIEFKK